MIAERLEKTTFEEWKKKSDYVIYHKGIAYDGTLKGIIKLTEAIGEKNAVKAFLRAHEQKTDKTVWKLRKHGKYEIHLK